SAHRPVRTLERGSYNVTNCGVSIYGRISSLRSSAIATQNSLHPPVLREKQGVGCNASNAFLAVGLLGRRALGYVRSLTTVYDSRKSPFPSRFNCEEKPVGGGQRGSRMVCSGIVVNSERKD